MLALASLVNFGPEVVSSEKVSVPSSGIPSRRMDMSRVRSIDTLPEMLVRKTLHSLGFRYRVHYKGLPGKPDIVFTRRNIAIFVHGCFWHQHPGCKRASTPASNKGYWGPKLARNVSRDRTNTERLEEAGWKVAVIWECETKNLDTMTRKLVDLLRG